MDREWRKPSLASLNRQLPWRHSGKAAANIAKRARIKAKGLAPTKAELAALAAEALKARK